MLHFPFAPTQVAIEIPRKFRAWFPEHQGAVPVELNGKTAKVGNGSLYTLQPLAGARYAVLRPGVPAGLAVAGVFDRVGVHQTLNNRFLHELNILRSAVFDVAFPAPLAYVLRDLSLVHPGPCFDQHHDVVTLRAVYSLKEDNARCVVCGRPFL